MRNRKDFIGDLLGVQRGLPLLTPSKPPGNPQATPSKHRINDSKIIQLDRRLNGDVTNIKK